MKQQRDYFSSLKSDKSPYSTGDLQIVHIFCMSAKQSVQYRPTQPGVGHLICGFSLSAVPQRTQNFSSLGKSMLSLGQTVYSLSVNVIFSMGLPCVIPNFLRSCLLANLRKLPLDLKR